MPLKEITNPFEFATQTVLISLDENQEPWFCAKDVCDVLDIFLVFRSNKPKAEEFANWVCETVLPSIRKTGVFGSARIKTSEYLSVIKQIDYLTRQITLSKNVFLVKTMLEQLRTLHNMVGSTMPSLEFVNADIEQCDLFLKLDN